MFEELYKMHLDMTTGVLTVGFGVPASNDAIVAEVGQSIKAIKSVCHGLVVKVNGAASLPVATVIGHELAHVCKALAVYDPKLAKYVVTICHDGSYSIGALID